MNPLVGMEAKSKILVSSAQTNDGGSDDRGDFMLTLRERHAIAERRFDGVHGGDRQSKNRSLIYATTDPFATRVSAIAGQCRRLRVIAGGCGPMRAIAGFAPSANRALAAMKCVEEVKACSAPSDAPSL